MLKKLVQRLVLTEEGGSYEVQSMPRLFLGNIMDKLLFILPKSSILNLVGNDKSRVKTIQWITSIFIISLVIWQAFICLMSSAIFELILVCAVFIFSLLIGLIRKGIAIDNMLFYCILALVLINSIFYMPFKDITIILLVVVQLLLGTMWAFALRLTKS